MRIIRLHGYIPLLSFAFLCIYSAFDFAYAAKAADEPAALTRHALSVEERSAVLNGLVFPGDDLTTSAWFEWGKTETLGSTTGRQSFKGIAEVSDKITGLDRGVTYFFRLIASNSNGTDKGTIFKFKTSMESSLNDENDDEDNGRVSDDVTSAFLRPVVQTRSSDHISETSVVLHGHAKSGLEDEKTTVWFQWGARPALGKTPPPQTFTGDVFDFSVPLLELKPNIQYYYRAVAENEEGISLGQVLTFVTASPPVQTAGDADFLTVATKGAENITEHSVTLQGLALLRSSKAVGWFELGETTEMKNKAPKTPLEKINTVNSFYSSISGLQPDTTYFYRALADDGFGVKKGSLLSFRSKLKTMAPPVGQKILPSPQAQGVGGTGGTLTIESDSKEIQKGDAVRYTVRYHNNGDMNFSEASIKIIFPAVIAYKGSDIQNVSVTNGDVVVSIGTVKANDSGTFTIHTDVQGAVSHKGSLTVVAVLSFTHPLVDEKVHIPSFTSHEVKADLNGVADVAGSGFWPSTITGWLILMLLVLLIFVAIVKLYKRSASRERNKGNKVMPAPGDVFHPSENT